MTTPANIWAFADVDDTLITSSRACPSPESVVGAVDNKDAVCGWISPKQAKFLALLSGNVNMVLTTARTSAGVSQLSLPLPEANRFAIVSFGGRIILPDGTSEPRFQKLIAEGSARYAVLLDGLCTGMQSYCADQGIDARIRLCSEDGARLFVSIKHNKRDMAAMSRLRDVLWARLPGGWTLHFNGNFIAALPPFLGKDKAVRWFMEQYVCADELTIGMGDSHSDLSFMALCDMAMVPTVSQIFSDLPASTLVKPNTGGPYDG
jgi:hydroxymethylpyrimidine pyrophosphatase-like HAD family hydrolase